MWRSLIGKHCKIVLKDGDRAFIHYGKVVDANDSFLVERDRFGKIHFLSTSIIERISEHPEVVGVQSEDGKGP